MVAWLFVTIFSYTTSPLYHVFGNTPDSPIFQIIGKYWAEGSIPYKDLWDLKGPFIFFVNALGYGMTGTSAGVYGIQVISLFLTLCVVYRILSRHFSSISSFVFTLLSLAGLSYTYEGGNLTEEYILFPLTLSFYYITRWLDKFELEHDVLHSPFHAFVYGTVLGLSLMTRLTNALSLCAAVGVITIILLWHKEYKNLLLNMLLFCIGFTIVTMPFIVYFYCHNVFTDMWNGIFMFALKYAGNSMMNLSDIGIHYFILSYLNSILLIIVSLLMLYRNNVVTVRAVLYLSSATIPFIWFCLGNGYGHYGMTVFPLFCLAMTEIHNMKLHTLSVAISLLVIIGAASKVRFMYIMYNWENKEVSECRQFLADVPCIDYSSFAAYECDPNLYLALNIRPAVPVFSLQEIGRDRIRGWDSFLTSLFQKSLPKWLLVKRYQTEDNIIIQPILNKNYEMVADSNELELYKLTK